MTENSKLNLTPAAIGALLDGDLENALIAATPGGIEKQEADGQAGLVAGTALPAQCDRRQFEAMGIEFGEKVDDLFVEAALPQGWKKEATDHSMHSKLLDDKGRERASIFYKAAFYDRRADMSASKRYSFSVQTACGWEDYDRANDEKWHCVVLDCEAVIWHSESIGPEPLHGAPRDTVIAWYDQNFALRKLGRQWLDEHYPEWRDPLAYWD